MARQVNQDLLSPGLHQGERVFPARRGRSNLLKSHPAAFSKVCGQSYGAGSHSKLLPFIKSPANVIVIIACPKRYTLNTYVHRKRDNRDSSVNRTSQLVAGSLPSSKPTADVSSAVSGPELRVRKRHSFPLRICRAPERPLVLFRSYDYRHQSTTTEF